MSRLSAVESSINESSPKSKRIIKLKPIIAKGYDKDDIMITKSPIYSGEYNPYQQIKSDLSSPKINPKKFKSK